MRLLLCYSRIIKRKEAAAMTTIFSLGIISILFYADLRFIHTLIV